MSEVNLEQMSQFVLCNLEKVTAEGYAKDVAQWISGTSINPHKAVWEQVAKFRQDNGKYPGFSFLKQVIEGIEDKRADDFTMDNALDFLSSVKNESITLRSIQELGKGNFEVVEKLMRQRVVRRETEKFGVDDSIGAYKEMTSKPAGILSGIAEVDEVLKGMSYGNMGVIAAPPGSFKTTLLISLVYNACFKSGFNFALFSFELMKRDMWFNLLSRHSLEMGSKIPAEVMKKGLMSPEQEALLVEVVEDWKKNCKGNITVLTATDFTSITPQDIDAKLEELDSERQLDGWGWDYIQLTSFYRPKGTKPEEYWNDMVRYVTQRSKEFKGRGLIGILLSQINRQGEIKLFKKRRASKDMLAEINALERDAHHITVLYADDAMRLNNSVLVQVIKNRSGRTMSDMVSVYVDPEAFLVGAAEFSNIFSTDAAALLQKDSGDQMFF